MALIIPRRCYCLRLDLRGKLQRKYNNNENQVLPSMNKELFISVSPD